MYGYIDKIEIFRKADEQFAYITYRRSRNAYFAITVLTENEKIVLIQPAPMHKQFTVPYPGGYAPIQRLPDFCLLKIFNLYNIHEQAMLSVVCERFRNVMKKHLLHTNEKISYIGNNPLEGIASACRFVQCINPKYFQLTFKTESLESLEKIFYKIEIDFNQTDRILEIERSYYNQYLTNFASIINWFRVLCIHVDKIVTGMEIISMEPCKSVRTLNIIGSGDTKTMPIMKSLNCLPELETIRFENIFFDANHQFDGYYDTSRKLCCFEFVKCKFNSDKSFLLGIINKLDKRSIQIIDKGIGFELWQLGSAYNVLAVSIGLV